MEALQLKACIHCGIPSSEEFCCQGCQSVYELLTENGLENFYSLRNKKKSIQDTTSNKKFKKNNFEHLNGVQILNQYALKTENIYSVDFYLEGIHCFGCQYLLENLYRLNKEITQSRFDFSKSLLTVSITPQCQLSQVASLIEKLGYTPHLIKERKEAKLFLNQQKKQNLIRIGVAAASSGNIMLLSIANYAGATGIYQRYFDYLSAMIAIPAIVYCAQPFYLNTYQAIKQKRISIDFPISLAIIFGSLVSFYSVFSNQDKIYFDSITGLIFLLLSSRFLQKSIEEKAAHFFQQDQYFEQEFVQKYDVKTGTIHQVLCEQIKIGDMVSINHGEMIPFDGKIIRGEGFINEALLTGESLLRQVKVEDYIFQGTNNAGNELLLEVFASGELTRVNQILRALKTENQKPTTLTIANKIGTYFLISVISLGLITILYFAFHQQLMVGIERAITLFIVTCPCALAIGTPLSFRQSYKWLFKRGIILKNMEPLEKILQIKKIFLDKTGTLTKGEIKVTQFSVIELDPKNEEILYSLEKRSKHPIAYSIVQYLEKRHEKINSLNLDNFKENIGAGVEAYYRKDFYQVKGHQQGVALFKNGIMVIQIQLRDILRDKVPFTINQLKKLGFSPIILSGDQRPTVEIISHQLEIDAYCGISPETKARIIRENPNSLMVGDGANDAPSLKEAHLAICMRGGLPLSLKVSEVYLANNNLTSILDLLTIAKETKKLIRRNLILSLFYNITAASLACSGVITPLLAAIFMPLSSLTVVLSNLFGTKKMRKYL